HLRKSEAIGKERKGKDKTGKDISEGAPGKPDAMGKAPVNWDNCKTDLQRLAAYYIKCYDPDWYASSTQEQATEFFAKQGKALKSILAQTGSLDVAKKTIDVASVYYCDRPKPLTWNLHTVAANMIEFRQKAKKEVEDARH
ncbi:MAG: hypothetical protein WC822_05745, partial [Candidatus Paceibacterota bacterium]